MFIEEPHTLLRSPRGKHHSLASSPEIYPQQGGNYEQCGTKFACHISAFAVVHHKRIKELLNERIVAAWHTTPGHTLPDLSLIHIHTKLIIISDRVNSGG